MYHRQVAVGKMLQFLQVVKRTRSLHRARITNNDVDLHHRFFKMLIQKNYRAALCCNFEAQKMMLKIKLINDKSFILFFVETVCVLLASGGCGVLEVTFDILNGQFSAQVLHSLPQSC